MNADLTGRLNFSCSITGNDPKKGPQKLQKLFKNVFFKKFPWRRRKQHESPAYFFRQPAELFPLDFQKLLVCKFSKRVSPEKFHWNWESSFDNSATFFARIGQKKSLSVQKWKKKLEIKLFFVKMLFWTRRKQLQHPCGKTRKEAENFLLNVWKW